MSRVLSDQIVSSVKELITVLSGFEETTDPFHHIYEYFITKLKKSDTMYFSSKRDIDQNISGMAEKFRFHGFFRQAEALQAAYKLYLPDSLPKSDSMNRLNVIKFLLCLSEAPTKHFLENPEMELPQKIELIEEVNWVEYLNEGIDKWNPNFDESDEDSYASFDDSDNKEAVNVGSSKSMLPVQIRSSNNFYVMDYKANREELLNTIQHTWYCGDKFFIKPESEWREANIGILWEKYLVDQVHGLVDLNRPSFTTEYKVIREILWQFWCPHTSTTIELHGNNIQPRSSITLPSVRSYAFCNFMNEFVQYIDLLRYFQEFKNLLSLDLYGNSNIISRTYQSYNKCINSVMEPIYIKLCDIENEVRLQETTYTLLKFAGQLSNVFEPLIILKQIHEQVILNPNLHTPLRCATTLIVRLHETFHFATNKLEQDLKISMFLESIRYYLELVEAWFIRDDLSDHTAEFVIEKSMSVGNAHLGFAVKENIEPSFKNNAFLKVFFEKVLKMGENINFLRLLGKYDIIGDFSETIYEEYINEIFDRLHKFYNKTKDECRSLDHSNTNMDTEIFKEHQYINPFSNNQDRHNPDMEKLENLVDVEDGFLMAAFSKFFTQDKQERHCDKGGLYQRISNLTTTLYPGTNIFENVLSNIIDERFTISGLMVKNLLIEDHLLEKQFEFLKHAYLFFDDLIFPFYRRLFEKTESSDKNWANDIWLTSHLQYIFMDIYPEFYEKCSVQVKDGRSLCTDSLSVCSLINIHYDIQWPLNIIIKQEQIELYQNIFRFLLKLKWALHTLNHLVFSDLESKNKSMKKSQKTYKAISHQNKPTAKLIRLKFYLINILNNLQHFVCGFIFSKELSKYELEFEKAHDLKSLIDTHASFINSVSSTIKNLGECTMEKDRTNNVIICVKLLKLMWTDLKYATPERISDCYKMYDDFYNSISPIIFPVHIYDY
ncbi:gamma-tubulin complex component 5-like [Sitophilus oryzae]|uniref:Gamma-tubulin complex component n=1 Tax=Sitophilus oryzae TaxID=7048 RepID=A0A6J2XAP9_SITOR|nr:gamma-tubulin complex component 5-like [Sitophilus oryzae]